MQVRTETRILKPLLQNSWTCEVPPPEYPDGKVTVRQLLDYTVDLREKLDVCNAKIRAIRQAIEDMDAISEGYGDAKH